MNDSAQRALAVAAIENASTRSRRAEDTAAAAWRAYNQIRRVEPGGQATDRARRSWAAAVHAVIDARAAEEQAHDELTALSDAPQELTRA